MPTIFDNIEQKLLPTLRETLKNSNRADFCVGYFHLRGWHCLADVVEEYAGTDDSCCRVLVGMQRPPEESMRETQRAIPQEEYLDGPERARRKVMAAERFKEQIEFGVPTVAAEATLRQLARQLRSRKVRLQLFLPYPLHAKLYLIHRKDTITPIVGYLGSSNLTFPGLSKQGELNVDVVDKDSAHKLQNWFDERWCDPHCIDISDDLATLIENGWASEALIHPYHVYLKMAYHLSTDAREGEREFRLPKAFEGVLLDFQERAVSLAAHYLLRNDSFGGALLGDVVGLGKTLMATAVAKVFQEDDDSNTLIICPPKLKDMWEWHVDEYDLTAKVISTGSVIKELPNLRRYRLVIIDESHNLRNREGTRYQAIRDYIEQNDPRVLLLTATPYNKQFTDLSNQLRLFIDQDQDLHIRPEKYFQWWSEHGYNEADFHARFNVSPRSLRAFEQSEFADDWRDLMKPFLVRRTRSYIMRNYAKYDDAKKRYYVMLNGKPSYFPVRKSQPLKFALDETNSLDQYARLYHESVVAVIEELNLPRYGLTQYLIDKAERGANSAEREILENLNRAGRRLIGFSRTNLFKRLESSGFSFLLSIERHIIRNMVSLYAIENNLPLPIGTQNAAMLDTLVTDRDDDWAEQAELGFEDEEGEGEEEQAEPEAAIEVEKYTIEAYQDRAAEVYETYRSQYRRRFRWLPAKFFKPDLKKHLLADAKALISVLKRSGEWQPARDTKLDALHELLTKKHRKDKVLIFTQFADTATYLGQQLKLRGVQDVAFVAGQSGDPTTLARRFSPQSNGGLHAGENELNVLIATDVLSEGQNLQDAHIIVNNDLPWAIIRLIQRAGRVDRIGQRHDTISLYSFVPVEGIEEIIKLRRRLSQRLEANQEVIGTDESFFGEDAADKLRDFYAGNADIASDDEDVDLSSTALQIWNSATEADRKAAEQLPPVVPATRPYNSKPDDPAGAIVYLRYPDGMDALVRVDNDGALISQSLSGTFRAAACAADTPALPRSDNHYELVGKAVEYAVQDENPLGGALGTQRSVSRRVYERLNLYRQQLQHKPTLFSQQVLQRLTPALDALFTYPLRESARDSLRRQVKLGIADEGLADIIIHLHEDDRLSVSMEQPAERPEPQILCSLGLSNTSDQE